MANKHTKDYTAKPYDEDGNNGWIDSPEFAAYCVDVHTAIVAMGGRATHAMIREYMGLVFTREWFRDAIDALMGIGVLKCTRDVFPQTYEVTEKPVEKRKSYNGNPVPPTAKDRPSPESFDFARDRVTA